MTALNHEHEVAGSSADGITCTTPGCRASVYWCGYPTDPALASIAHRSGWKVLEGAGWTCPHHLQSKEQSAS